MVAFPGKAVPVTAESLIQATQAKFKDIDPQLIEAGLRATLEKVSLPQVEFILNSLDMADTETLKAALKLVKDAPYLLDTLVQMTQGDPEQTRAELEGLPEKLESLALLPGVGSDLKPAIPAILKVARAMTAMAMDVARQQKIGSAIGKAQQALEDGADKLRRFGDAVQGDRHLLEDLEQASQTLSQTQQLLRGKATAADLQKAAWRLEYLIEDLNHIVPYDQQGLVAAALESATRARDEFVPEALKTADQRTKARVTLEEARRRLDIHMGKQKDQIELVTGLFVEARGSKDPAQQAAMIKQIDEVLAPHLKQDGITVVVKRKSDGTLDEVGFRLLDKSVKPPQQIPPRPERAGDEWKTLPAASLIRIMDTRQTELVEKIAVGKLKKLQENLKKQEERLQQAIAGLEADCAKLPASARAPKTAQIEALKGQLQDLRVERKQFVGNTEAAFEVIDLKRASVQQALRTIIDMKIGPGGQTVRQPATPEQKEQAREELAKYGFAVADGPDGKPVVTYHYQDKDRFLHVAPGQPMTVWQMYGAVSQSCATEKLMEIEGCSPDEQAGLDRTLAGLEKDLQQVTGLASRTGEPAAQELLRGLMEKYRLQPGGDGTKDVAALAVAIKERRQQVQDHLFYADVIDVEKQLQARQMGLTNGTDGILSGFDWSARLEREMDKLEHEAAKLDREMAAVEHDAEDLQHARTHPQDPRSRAAVVRLGQRYGVTIGENWQAALPELSHKILGTGLALREQKIEVERKRCRLESTIQAFADAGLIREEQAERLRQKSRSIAAIIARFDGRFRLAAGHLGYDDQQIGAMMAAQDRGDPNPAAAAGPPAGNAGPDDGSPAQPGGPDAGGGAAASPAQPGQPAGAADQGSFFSTFKRNLTRVFGTSTQEHTQADIDQTSDAYEVLHTRKENQQDYLQTQARKHEQERKRVLEELSLEESDRRLKDAGLRQKDLGEQVHDQVIGTHEARQRQIERDRLQGKQ